MFNKYKKKIQKNAEIIALSLLVLIAIISTSYYNYNKKKIYNNYKNTIHNLYFKKTINYFFDNLEPKFKTIHHKVKQGETFDDILKTYDIEKSEIQQIKSELSKKININKLNTTQKIQINLDQSNNLIKEFIFRISSTEKIFLKKDTETDKFNQQIVLTKLRKNIVYKENIILSSLYNSASSEKIPANIIIEFARIY